MALDPEVARRFDDVEKLLKLVLMASGSSLPTTSVATSFSGNQIGTTDRYLNLWTNTYDRLIALKIVGAFAIPGATAKLSLEQSDAGLIEVLSSTGKVISDTIWLKPGQRLFINTNDVVFTLNGSTFSVLMFDGINYMEFVR
jgi:hypothetical protein